MAKLFLIRHSESQWNKDKRFAGWADNPLSLEGSKQAEEVGELIKNESFDKIYTSELIRNIETVMRLFINRTDKYPVFVHIDGGKRQTWGTFSDTVLDDAVAVFVTEKLNERYYGKLQGVKHQLMIDEHGVEQIQKWRRDYATRPPGGESLKDTHARVLPFYKKYILKDLQQGKNVLVVSSGNALRAMIKEIEQMKDEDMINFELPFGALRKYEFDGKKFTNLHL